MTSKYRNKKVMVDEFLFDSQAEAAFYATLKENDDIAEIRVHPRFLLIPKYTTTDGIKRRAKYYVADFLVVYKDGREEIWDVKGMETDLFRFKRDLFEYQTGKILNLWKKNGRTR